jgi:hypothetical protein
VVSIRDSPKPIQYELLVQCSRSEVGVIAHYKATTPFPTLHKTLELLDCDPSCWDVHYWMTRIVSDEQEITILTLVLVIFPFPVNRYLEWLHTLTPYPLEWSRSICLDSCLELALQRLPVGAL